MQASRKKVKRALRKACSRHLWRAVPKEIEDKIVDAAINQISAEDINSSPYGCLFELAVEIITVEQGYGCFVTIYDEEVTLKPSETYGVFLHETNGTYVKIK